MAVGTIEHDLAFAHLTLGVDLPVDDRAVAHGAEAVEVGGGGGLFGGEDAGGDEALDEGAAVAAALLDEIGGN